MTSSTPTNLQNKFENIIRAVFPDGSSDKVRLTHRRKKELENFYFAGCASTHALYLESSFMNQDAGTKLMADVDAEIAAKTGTNRMMDGPENDQN